jgi:hypothetical protein
MRLEQDLEPGTEAQLFRKAALPQLLDGISAAKEAGQTHSLAAQRAGFERALASFRSCERNGARVVSEHRALGAAAIAILPSGERLRGKDVIARCAEQAGTAAEELRKVVGLLTFEEGPKASFEKGKALLLEEGPKSQALAQFEECISSGRILEHKNPELKDQHFEVGGSAVTLPQLITACTTERQRLRGR